MNTSLNPLIFTKNRTKLCKNGNTQETRTENQQDTIGKEKDIDLNLPQNKSGGKYTIKKTMLQLSIILVMDSPKTVSIADVWQNCLRCSFDPS